MLSSPRRFKDFICGCENVFLLGEAAGFVSASSFEGISSAILSGKLLADAFAHSSNPNVQKVYRKNTRVLRLKLYTKAIKRAILCNPFTRGLIMKSGIQSITPYAKTITTNHRGK